MMIKQQHIKTATAITVIVVAVVILRKYSPLEEAFFPRCITLSLTGYKCPGCGSQRALHELLNLHIGAAFRFNPLVVVSIPYLLLGFIIERVQKQRMTKSKRIERLRNILYGRNAIIVILVIIVAFTILRNIL